MGNYGHYGWVDEELTRAREIQWWEKVQSEHEEGTVA